MEKRKLILPIALLVSLAALGGIIALGVVWQKKLTPFQDYSVVIDAGSTHSKIFVYSWPADKSDGLGTTSRIKQEIACDVHGGAITSLTDLTLAGVKAYFESDMNQCISKVPMSRRSRALIFLAGTAGLRLYEMKNPVQTDTLLKATQNYFGTLGLYLPAPSYQVRIINGSEEGLAGWTSSNMLLRRLFSDVKPPATYGVLDLGGASTQISFYSPQAKSDAFNMVLFNQTYPLYSHSFLCYGIEEFRRVYLATLVKEDTTKTSFDDPCLQPNYSLQRSYSDIFETPCVTQSGVPVPGLNTSSIFTFNGVGNGSLCRERMRAHINTTTCAVGETCSFNGVNQPMPIPTDLSFVGISNGWFATFSGFAGNLSVTKDSNGNYAFTGLSIATIDTKLDEICQQSWSELPNPDKFRFSLCFNGIYQWMLYSYGYKMTDSHLQNFQVVKKVGTDEIGWTMGYMINQTNSLDAQYRPARLLTKGQFAGSLVAVIIVFLLSTAIFIFALATRRTEHVSVG